MSTTQKRAHKSEAHQANNLDNNLALPGRFLKQADPQTPVEELGAQFRAWKRAQPGGAGR